MNEDSQPNERSLNRKGASVPVIRSTRGRSRGTFQPGYGPRHYQRPPNRPQAGPYSFRSPSKHQQYPYPSKRLKPLYDGPYSKRRQFDHESNSSSHSRYITSNAPFPASRPSAQPRKSTPYCKKGVADSQHLRSDRRTKQVRDLSTKTDASTRYSGYVDVQPVMDNRSRAHNESHVLPEDLIPGLTSTGLDASSTPRIPTRNVYDEIIIVEDIDALGISKGNFRGLSPPSPQTQSSNLNSSSEPFLTMTHESSEPPRVFKSGVFSVSSTESDSLSSSAQPYLQLTTSLVPSVLAQPGSSTHTSAICRKNPNSPGLVSDPSIERYRQAPSDHDHGTIRTLNNSTSPCTIPSTLLRLSQSDKVRRIIPFNKRSIASVSMRGSIDLIDAKRLSHQHSLKAQRPNELIDDACIVQAGDDFLVVLGHARDHEQLSWFRSRYGTAEGKVLALQRPWITTKKGGVSAITSMIYPMQFATGGYDHTVHLWDVKSDLSSASPRTLAINHTSTVQSLLSIRDTSHKLISAGADCNAHIWDLSSERVVNTMRPSNAIYHLHTLTSPFCTLLEIANRELQFEVRDHRLVPEYPVLRFGYDLNKVHGRFIKGAASSRFFASGSRDGYLRQWDLRNVDSVATIAETHPGQKIIQVVFKEANLIVCTEAGQASLFRYKH